MSTNFMMIGLIFWSYLTAFNYILCKNLLLGCVFFCYGTANIFLFYLGNK